MMKKRFSFSHMQIFLLVAATILFQVPCNNAVAQQIRTFQQLNNEALELFKQGRGAQFEEASANLLREMSKPALHELLTLRAMPILSLSALHTLSKRSGKSDSEALILLLANAESVLFFEDQFIDLDALARDDETAINTLSSLLRFEREPSTCKNLTLILRGLNKQTLLALFKKVRTHSIPASNLSQVIDALCAKSPDWKTSEFKDELIAALEELKPVPGWAQITLLAYYDFATPADAVPHLQLALNDKDIPTAVVVLAAKRFSDLVMKSEFSAQLNALGQSRVQEFKKRLVK